MRVSGARDGPGGARPWGPPGPAAPAPQEVAFIFPDEREGCVPALDRLLPPNRAPNLPDAGPSRRKKNPFHAARVRR